MSALLYLEFLYGKVEGIMRHPCLRVIHGKEGKLILLTLRHGIAWGNPSFFDRMFKDTKDQVTSDGSFLEYNKTIV